MALLARFRLIASCLATMLCHAVPAAAGDGYWTEPAYAAYPAKGPDKALGSSSGPWRRRPAGAI